MKWDIQKRLLVLVLAAGILSFLTLSGLSFYGVSIMRGEMLRLGEEVSKAGANFTESLTEYQLKQTLGELAKARAEFIDNEMKFIQKDVEILSHTMTKIASNPGDYKPIKLRDPRFDEVKNFEPNIIYSPETFLNGMTPENISPELRNEIGIASNIANVLVPLSKSFAKYKSSFNVGSRNGYFIGVTLYPEVEGALDFEEADIYKYD